MLRRDVQHCRGRLGRRGKVGLSREGSRADRVRANIVRREGEGSAHRQLSDLPATDIAKGGQNPPTAEDQRAKDPPEGVTALLR